jgi:hypothetical protein
MARLKYGIRLHTDYRMRREEWLWVAYLCLILVWAPFVGYLLGRIWLLFV